MYEVTARLRHEVLVHCPHCGSVNDVTDGFKDVSFDGSRIYEVEKTVECTSCKKLFLTTKIER